MNGISQTYVELQTTRISYYLGFFLAKLMAFSKYSTALSSCSCDINTEQIKLLQIILHSFQDIHVKMGRLFLFRIQAMGHSQKAFQNEDRLWQWNIPSANKIRSKSAAKYIKKREEKFIENCHV